MLKDNISFPYQNLIDYRICELLYIEMKKTNYSTFKNMCENLKQIAVNGVKVKSLENILANVISEISILYAIDFDDSAKIIVSFLKNEKWSKYHDIVLAFYKNTPNSFN